MMKLKLAAQSSVLGPSSSSRLASEQGSALIITLMATMLLTALGVALVLTTSTETLITANYRTAQEAMYAADAGVERTIQDIIRVANWNTILGGTVKSSFVDNGAGTLPDGATVDLTKLTSSLQTDTNNTYGAGPNTPIWRLYAYSPMSALLAGSAVTSRDYVVVWVADDAAETDGNPSLDTNGLVTVHAESYGQGGSKKVVEVSLMAVFATETDSGYVGQRGGDEQNQGNRKAPVGTPGTELTEMRMTTAGGLTVQ